MRRPLGPAVHHISQGTAAQHVHLVAAGPASPRNALIADCPSSQVLGTHSPSPTNAQYSGAGCRAPVHSLAQPALPWSRTRRLAAASHDGLGAAAPEPPGGRRRRRAAAVPFQLGVAGPLHAVAGSCGVHLARRLPLVAALLPAERQQHAAAPVRPCHRAGCGTSLRQPVLCAGPAGPAGQRRAAHALLQEQPAAAR